MKRLAHQAVLHTTGRLQSPVVRSRPGASMATSKDWSAAQYLKFHNERTRAVRDLLAQVPLASPKQVVDLGCGPGNSTEVLLEHFPTAAISAIDSSPDMIAKAQAALPQLTFALDNLTTYTPTGPVDLFFCNAVLHWIPVAERIPLIARLIGTQAAGGVFAFQVPNNLSEPSHRLMEEVAAHGPWAPAFKANPPTRDAIDSPQELYDSLKPLCSRVDIWQTEYQHALENHQAIVEWLKSTGLKPYIDPLSAEQREQFLAAYLDKLKHAYPSSHDGRVLLSFPRLFVVCTRK